jgi:cell division protein FtsB
MIAIVIQVVRNILWTKTSQTQRMALLQRAKSPERWRETSRLLWYTAASYTLYVISFLLLLSANLFILIAVGGGNILGVYYSMETQTQDAVVQLDEEMVGMLSSYDNLSNKKSNLTKEEEKEMAEMKLLKKDLMLFLGSQRSSHSEYQESQASEARKYQHPNKSLKI